MCQFFEKRGYPASVIQAAHHRAQQIDRQSALQTSQKEKNDRIPFTLTFHPRNNPVKAIILNNFKILLNDPETGAIFSTPFYMCAGNRFNRFNRFLTGFNRSGMLSQNPHAIFVSVPERTQLGRARSWICFMAKCQILGGIGTQRMTRLVPQVRAIKFRK